MRSLMKSGVLVGVALLAAALVGVTLGDEPPKDTLQGSWNDYPAKWIGNSEIPNVTPSYGTPEEAPRQQNSNPDGLLGYPDVSDGSEDEGDFRIPEIEGGNPPIRRPPPQQQQGKPSGGGFAWGGGKTGGGGFFGGKQGGSFTWGKTRPPQSQQGPRPGGGQPNPSEAQLLQYIRQLEQQNAALRELLQRLAGQMNNGTDGERSPGLPNNGTPLY